ncbi:MAG: DNA-binding protein [Candidatus Binatia bacterium]|nr:MAG: DNA-binding protein [Candidatus Binatia bacterium]
MAQRAKDWLRHADARFSLARHAAAGRHFEWACFAAQQSAEKAVKALHDHLGNEAWGQFVTESLEALPPDVNVPPDLLDRARALDKLYIPTRGPNGLPAGAPADFFTGPEAAQAIAAAEEILAFCRRAIPGP